MPRSHLNELKIITVLTPAMHSCHYKMLQKSISRAKIIPEWCIVTGGVAFSLNSGLSLRELHPFENTGWNTEHLSHVLFFSLFKLTLFIVHCTAGFVSTMNGSGRYFHWNWNTWKQATWNNSVIYLTLQPLKYWTSTGNQFAIVSRYRSWVCTK